MPRNVEVKAKIRNLEEILQKAEGCSDTDVTIIRQEDTFYKTDTKRLKLRKFDENSGELISYNRPDAEGPKTSTFAKAAVINPDELAAVLSDALQVRGKVEKVRKLFLAGQTRIHVDDVKGLGHFMELEVMLQDNQSVEDGEKIAHELLEKLGVQKEDLISGAYIDLLEKQ